MLVPDMRQLGDVYTKVEFRQHKDAKPQFVEEFIIQWNMYCDDIEKGQIGKGITEDQLDNDLSADQQMQLYELMKETTKPAPQFAMQDPFGQKKS